MNGFMVRLLMLIGLSFTTLIAQADMRVCDWSGPGKFYTHGAGRYCIRTVVCSSPSGQSHDIIQDYVCRATACDTVGLCAGDDSLGTTKFYEDFLNGRVFEESAQSYEQRNGESSWPQPGGCNCSTPNTQPQAAPAGVSQ